MCVDWACVLQKHPIPRLAALVMWAVSKALKEWQELIFLTKNNDMLCLINEIARQDKIRAEKTIVNEYLIQTSERLSGFLGVHLKDTTHLASL